MAPRNFSRHTLAVLLLHNEQSVLLPNKIEADCSKDLLPVARFYYGYGAFIFFSDTCTKGISRLGKCSRCKPLGV